MRRKMIQLVLPLLFCSIPILAAAVVASAIEAQARRFYIDKLTGMDILILTVGAALFVAQMLLAWRALRWRGPSFDERPDPWLSNLAQAAEWFPMLGLLGTVAAILQTFGGLGEKDMKAREIIGLYAPAITATGSGLFMALINILPSWLVPVGRDTIRALGGAEEPTPPQAPIPIATASGSNVARVSRPAAGADAGS